MIEQTYNKDERPMKCWQLRYEVREIGKDVWEHGYVEGTSFQFVNDDAKLKCLEYNIYVPYVCDSMQSWVSWPILVEKYTSVYTKIKSFIILQDLTIHQNNRPFIGNNI